MKKIFEFKEYLKDFIMMQYGLRNIALHNFDFILQVLDTYLISYRDFSTIASLAVPSVYSSLIV